MEVVYFSNEFPREDLQDVFRRLHNHGKDTRHTLLAQFIAAATRVVRDEIRDLSTDLKQLFQPFETVLSWAEDSALREGLLCGAVDGVLLVVAQIASYIGFVERNPERLRDFSNTYLSALGVGLIASTAVALSPNVGDLPLAGADAVRIAFRMGIHVQHVSDILEARDLSESPETWAFVVHNVDPKVAEQALDTYNLRQGAPETGKIFVSAVSRTSITISGPPTRLRPIFDKSEYFRGTKFIALPVYGGLCHAPHIYSDQDTRNIVHGGRVPLNTVKSDARPVLPIYSTSTGEPYLNTTAADVFESVVSELLMNAIRWDNVINRLVTEAKLNAIAGATLHCFGNSIPLNDLVTALQTSMSDVKTSTNNLMSWIFQPDPSNDRPRSTAQSKLAIVGMSCRLPGGATNTEKFWEILEQGLDVSRRIPADRFDIDTHYDPTGKDLNKTMTQYGCFVDEPGLFDAPFFNMSPREAQVVDPQMRLALVTAFEALERAGYVSNRTASTLLQRIGTYYGQAADDYREVNQGQEVSTYYIPGGCRAFGPGRINYFFKFAGPSYSIDTACSSGLAAIEVACQALWDGNVDMAVAGGVNVLTNPDGFAGLCNGHFLTKGHNACKTWDATADGYCRADGIGSLVIKRLEDAEADNDHILGVILAAGTNHSAEAVSITHPHAGHQAYLSRQVLRQAGVDPLDISYIELHGTGTQAGDYEEMQGIMDVYAPVAHKRRAKDQPLHIGSVKANVGHGESVAGTTALIKVLMMLQKNAIPPHIGIKTGEINPRFPRDFDQRNLHIAREMTPWVGRDGTKRRAAVNNFGAAGGNTMMILEEAPTRPALTDADDVRRAHVVAVSAKTKASLTGNLQNLLAYLETHPDTRVADLAYTTTARRYQYSYRVAVAVAAAPAPATATTATTPDLATLKKQLTAQLARVDTLKPVGKSDPPPLAFAFTGQGASHKSMSLELYRDVPSVRAHLRQLDALARAQGFPTFLPALDGSHPPDHAHAPVVTQLALVAAEIALARYWGTLGVRPDLVVGHSLGEFAALHVAGVVTANEALFMAGKRAQLLQERCRVGSHTMMAVRASLAQIREGARAAGLAYTVACVNGPADTVLSGTTEDMAEVAKVLEAAGYKCIKLDVAFAFHSEQTDPILDDFEEICKGVVFQEPKLPVISPLLGNVVFDGKTFNAAYMRRGTRETVDFVSALESALKISTVTEETVWVEIGPHPVCVGFIKSIMSAHGHRFTAVPSVRRGDSNWKTMSESLAVLHSHGIPIDWNEIHRPFEAGLRLLDLPTYAWSEKNYWLPYKGNWCLTKGNSFYDVETESASSPQAPAVVSEISTSVVQQIIALDINGPGGVVQMQSDLMQADFLEAANGHRMNDCGVVTSSIHADIAYTLGTYLYRKILPDSKGDVKLDITNLHVEKGLVAQRKTRLPQLIRVTAQTADINSGIIDVTWHNVDEAGNDLPEAFATAQLVVGDARAWLSAWEPVAHLVAGRIEALDGLARAGAASRFTRSMAYQLFARNLVDYAEKYRGMQTVTMQGFEAYADVRLTTKESGSWTVPPYFIDSVAHLAGFVMNCTDGHDVQKNYCVTPGWRSMRFAEPLVAGAQYRSYVKMIPTKADPTVFVGDVYIMDARDSSGDSRIVGMVGGIEFRRYPRILLNRFFSPPDSDMAAAAGGHNGSRNGSNKAVAPPAIAAAGAAATATPTSHSYNTAASRNSAATRGIVVTTATRTTTRSTTQAALATPDPPNVAAGATRRAPVAAVAKPISVPGRSAAGQLDPAAAPEAPPQQPASSAGAAATAANAPPAAAGALLLSPPVAPLPASADAPSSRHANGNTTTAKALQLIADEAALELADLTDDAAFASLGIDSLMSLVISEKFRTNLDVKVGGSLFLDYPTIGDLRKWLDEYYS